MAGPVLVDRVAEWTATTGTTRPYVLMGTFGGNMPFASEVPDGDWVYYEAHDGSARMEHGKARFTAPNLLDPTEYLSTTNGGAAVNWPVGLRPIIHLVLTPANLLAEEQFWNAVTLGDAPDLGDLSDQEITSFDMGELFAGVENDMVPVIEMGELT